MSDTAAKSCRDSAAATESLLAVDSPSRASISFSLHSSSFSTRSRTLPLPEPTQPMSAGAYACHCLGAACGTERIK
jgi:hypothetical protein